MTLEHERVKRSKIMKRIQVTDRIFISIRAEEITVYKVISKRGKRVVVYTLDASEWKQVLPVLDKIVRNYA